MPRSPRRTFFLATILFLASGALGLGYEWIWIRKAALVVGTSQAAISAVLTAFFLGLAAGSYVVGRFVRTGIRSPLATYGVFEILIGLFAIAFPLLFQVLGTVYNAFYPRVGEAPVALLALRFVLLFMMFIGPTFLMGGTLPLLLHGLVTEDRSIGSRTSLLYGVNVLGAVAGILCTAYFAVPLLGLNASSVVAGMANLGLGAVAFTAFRGLETAPLSEDHPPLSRFFAALSLVSGLLALAYQICWARYFSLIHFHSVYSTAVLLAVYLLALATGSLLLAPILFRRWNALRIFGIVQTLVPVATWACLHAWQLADYRWAIRREWTSAGQAIPSITLETAHDYPKFWHFLGETPDAVFFAPFFQIALSIFVPVLFLGAGLPSLIGAVTQSRASLKSLSGRIVFFNTLGASLGSFLAGYLLIPGVGLHKTLLLLGGGSVALAFFASRKSGAPLWAQVLIPGLGLAAVLGAAIRLPDITSETIRLRQIGKDADRAQLKNVVEGPLTTAYTLEDASTLRVGSGAVQMGNVFKSSVGLQLVEGHLPVLFYPGTAGPKDCLGICLGSGQSFGALLRHPILHLDVVEISGEIVRLARGPLAAYNNGLASDGRVRFHLDDGRHFVERAPARSFDLISMESPPPIAEGAHLLYTVEFYRQLRRVLRPGGVFMQFMPLYYLTPMDARSVMKTLLAEFPYVFVVRVSPGDFMLLAYPELPRFSQTAIRLRAEALASEWTVRGLAPGKWFPESAAPIASLDGVVAMLMSGPEEIRRQPPAPILRDDRPLLSYTTGDRWLTRRYMGPSLSLLGLAAVPVAPVSSLAAFFDPPLDGDQIEVLTDERAGILRGQGIPHPRELERGALALELAVDPGDRVRRALDLAVLYDAAFRKEDALLAIETAVATLFEHPDRFRPEWIEPARGVILNRLAVHASLVERRIQAWNSRYPGSPLLAPLNDEWNAYRGREAAGNKLYWFR